jgi:DNA-binding response OmpR family regulator
MMVTEPMTRVLVVDDDPTIREVIGYALGDEGYLVDGAADGQAALDLIGLLPPDVILLDMKMPGIDGWEFVKRYRARYGEQTPIIVLTASEGADQRGAAIDAAGYVAKPFDLSMLIESVAAAARRANATNH